MVGIKVSQNELNIIKLPPFIKNLIIGVLLSDGYIIFSEKNKNGRLSLTQSLSNSGYLYFVFNILSPYCPKYPIKKDTDSLNKLFLA